MARAPLRAASTGALGIVALACVGTGCAAGGPAGYPAVVTAPSASTEADEGSSRLPRYRSKRLALSLPLPDGPAWRIDDHSQPELVATHAATKSRVVVAIVRADELVGRTQCESLARARHLVPIAPLSLLREEVGPTQGTYDTRIEVGLVAGTGPEQPISGHVMAFGGYLRKCYVFDYATEVRDAASASVLADRLAIARARILAGLRLDAFNTTPRLEPGGGLREARGR